MAGYRTFEITRPALSSGRPSMPVVSRELVGRSPVAVEPEVIAPVPVEAPPVEAPEPGPIAIPLTPERRAGTAPLRGLDCLKVIEAVTGMPVSALIGKTRKPEVVKARQIAAWLIVTFAKKSLPLTGRMLGGQDHTTVLHGCRRVRYAMRDLKLRRLDDAVAMATALWVATWPEVRRDQARRPC